MSLKQIEVTKCEDCPFLNTDSDSNCPFTYECNAADLKDIDDPEKTPDWCPLLKYNFIEVLHIKN